MMLFLFACFAFSAHLAIDFGTQFCKTSKVKSYGAPEIADNYESERLTPTFIGFRAQRNFSFDSNDPPSNEEIKLLSPVFGDQALTVMSQRPLSVTGLLPLFLDMSQEHIEQLSSQLLVNPKAARVELNDLLTLFFKLYIDCVSGGVGVSSVSVAVPSTFTFGQRRAIESAIRGAGFEFGKCVDDVEAIIDLYALEKTRKFVEKPWKVLFVDVGAGSIKAYVVKFVLVKEKGGTQGRAAAERLSYAVKEEQGGAFLTARLTEYLKKKVGVSKTTKGEDRRIADAAEKAKKMLSLLREITVTVEDVDAISGPVKLTREELEDEFADLVNDVLETAGKATEGLEFDDIELIGGSSRIPMLQEALQKKFGVQTLGRSLNADEAIAMGTGYAVQYSVRLSGFSDVGINNSFPVYSVSLSDGNETHTICLSKKQCVREITLSNVTNQIVFSYNKTELNPHLITTSWGYKIDGMEENETAKLKLFDSPVDLEKVDLCNGSLCRDAEHVPIVPIVSSSPLYNLIIAEVQTKKKLGRMHNELEHFALRIVDEVENNASVIAVTTEEQRKNVTILAQEMKQWIWDYADKTTNETAFKIRLAKLREAMKPIYTRIVENQTYIREAYGLQRILAATNATLVVYETSKWVNQTLVREVRRIWNETMMWFYKSVIIDAQTPAWEPRPTKGSEMKAKADALYKSALKLIKTEVSQTPPKRWLSNTSNRLSSFFNGIKKFFGFGKNATKVSEKNDL